MAARIRSRGARRTRAPRWATTFALVLLVALLLVPSVSLAPQGASGSRASALTARNPGTTAALSAPSPTVSSDRAVGSALPALPAASTALWMNVSTPPSLSPSPRIDAAVAYDAHDGYTVLFGGISSSSHPLNDTWTYRAGVWTNITSTLRTAPSPRSGAGFTYDPAGPYLLLYGGCAAVCFNDTWTFSGGAWHAVPQPPLGSVPSARGGVSLAYVSSVAYPVLFGGARGTHVLSDTWAWRATRWQNLTPFLVAPTPSARDQAPFADDPALSEGVLFGGVRGTLHFSDTWSFHAGNWTNLTSTLSVSPSARARSLFAFDPSEGIAILYGGCGTAGCTADTWSFGTAGWTRLIAPSPPGALLGATGAFDGRDGYLLLEAGRKGLSDVGWTWAYGQPVRVAAVHAVPPTLDVGQTLALWSNATGGNGSLSWTWNGLPTGCTSQNSSHLSCVATTVGAWNVTATVSAWNGLVGTSRWAIVSVNAALQVTIAPSGVTGAAPFVVVLSSTGSGGTPPASYVWDFGDGSRATGQNTTHVYGLAGSYTATVWFNDSVGGSTSASVVLTVFPPLRVSVWLSGNGTNPRVPVVVSSSESGGLPTFTYVWTLNGTAIVGANTATLNYLPAGSGNFSFVLTVNDSLGDRASARVVLHVLPHPASTGAGSGGSSGFVADLLNDPAVFLVGAVLGIVIGVLVGWLLLGTSKRRAKSPPPQPDATPGGMEVAPGPPGPAEMQGAAGPGGYLPPMAPPTPSDLGAYPPQTPPGPL